MAGKLRAILGLAVAVPMSACEPGVHGVVRDAATEAPVADSMVGLSSRGFGAEDDQIIWDKDSTDWVETATDGSFSFEASEGVEISVKAPGYSTVHAPICSESPLIVRVGGPFARSVHQQLLLGEDDDGSVQGWDFAAGSVSSESGDFFIKALPDQGQRKVEFSAPLGLSFRAGTGNPPLPPTKGYVPALEINLMTCGWLFVRTGQSGTVAVQTGQLAIGDFSGGGQQLSLTYVLP